MSYVTDTPDFWRREGELYPQHGARFTGEPAYFRHIVAAGSELMASLAAKASDYAHAVFHQPNPKFPSRAGRLLGFSASQVETGLLVRQVGNTYAGSALLGLTAVLDKARAGERILVVAFGSGAGSDAFSFRVTDRARTNPSHVRTTADYVSSRQPIDYATYARHRKKIAMA